MEQADEEGLGGFLEGGDGLALPSVGSVVRGDVLADFANLFGGLDLLFSGRNWIRGREGAH